MRRLVITAAARRDAAAMLRESRASFGPDGRARYARLLQTAYRDLQEDPSRLHARRRSAVPDVWTYAVRHSRSRVAGERVGSPRHLIAFTYDAATVRILRVLHDRMDIEQHLTSG